MNVRISVRSAANHATEIGSTDLMEHAPLSGNFGATVPAGMTLQAAVFAGLVNPGQLEIVREILTGSGGTDTALFSGPATEYTVTFNNIGPLAGSVTVDHLNGTGADGIDTLRNVERLGFCLDDPIVPGECTLRSFVALTPPPPAPAITLSDLTNLTTFVTPVGLTSPSEPITVTNSGTTNLVISAVTLDGAPTSDFLVTANTCTGATIVPAATCTISVAFRPTTIDLALDTLRIFSNTPDGEDLVILIGDGRAAAANITSAALQPFATNVGTTSAAQTVTVTNGGNANLTIGALSFTGTDPTQFTVTSNGCNVAIAPGASCNISVDFRPTTAGAKSATLVLPNNTPNGDLLVPVSGTGLAPVIGITAPAGLTAFATAVNVTSAPVTVTVTNTGDANLVVSGVAFGGANPTQFVLGTNTCAPLPVTLAPAATCTISVAFRPTTTGPKTATLVLTHNAAGSPTSVNLAGNTVAGPPPPAAPVLVMPATTDFGTRRVGTTRTQSIRITNNGPGALLITSVSTTGAGFTGNRGNCPASLAVGRSCNASVTFAPTAAGAFTGSIVVISNAVGNPRTAGLTGTGR